MRLGSLLAVPLLIVVLSWLSMRAINPDEERFDRALAETARFARVEGDLHRDVLSARAGLLRNYDPLVQETDALDASLSRLSAIVGTDSTAAGAIHRLAATLGREEEWIEQFKSNDALLHNSLAFFVLLSSELSSLAQSNPPPPVISDLAAAMLRLTLDTSTTSTREVRDRLDQLADGIRPIGEAGPAAALLAHGRVLDQLLPATDDILKTLQLLPLKRGQDAVEARILQQQAASRAMARRFRVLLYIASLLLVGLLVSIGLQLRLRVRALRRRANFEHVLTGISSRFINTGSQDIESAIVTALAEMGRCVGVERAYFLASKSSEKTFQWCGAGTSFMPGWPEQAWQLMERIYPSFQGLVHVPRVTRLPHGPERDALAAAGVQGWACVADRRADGCGVLLGFEAVAHPCRIMRDGELGLLYMALDSISNALGRRALEQERGRLETRLQQARRLETVGALASGIAHNFNNIVGAILGYTEIATERNASTQIIDEIRRAGERARELVDQILTFARRREARYGAVSMQMLTAEGASLLRASLPNTIELMTGEVPAHIFVSGVPGQLQQVILNLCNNAAQAMDKLGRITLEVEPVDQVQDLLLSHGALASGRYVRITVTDTGSGIEEAAMERIFEPFFTTRMTGNGLGLATSYDIVREHGGAMHVESAPGVGSRFEVWLPRIDGTRPAPDDAIPGLPLGNGETVLLVESDPERLLRDEELLAALGYEPVGYTCATDARAAFHDAPERFDALVVGHLAPVASALELTAAVRAGAAELPILLASVSHDGCAIDALVAAGISDVVPLPITAAEIAVALQNCLRRRVSHASATRPAVGSPTRVTSS